MGPEAAADDDEDGGGGSGVLLQGAEAGSSASILRSTAARRLRAPTAESWSSIGCGQAGGANLGNIRGGRAMAAGRRVGI